ncbi:MAG: ATP-binding cassette domain-containing protein [Chloroflexota bacterium]|nr:ATP-binding cassette domain-containing protein [Chloroflexota bacterium]
MLTTPVRSLKIVVEHLSRTFRVVERPEGLRASLVSLVRRRFREVEAVRDISFVVQPGEVVGFLGPNGAGKSTTLKMLAGLMHPSAGAARVAGFVPWERRPEYLQRISMVLGNKSQLVWGLPPLDTFRVLGEIYGVPAAARRRTVDELVALLDLKEVVEKPARFLSLGERMKCELVAALLHQPEVLFLHEPTLGLDTSMQQRLRAFVGDYNRRTGATVVLTSHSMADVSALCRRVVVIHRGGLIYDGDLRALAERLAPYKLIEAVLDSTLGVAQSATGVVAVAPGTQAATAGAWAASAPPEAWEAPPGATILERTPERLRLRVERGAVPAVTAHLLGTLSVIDLSVEDPPLEAVIDRVYAEAVA